jgi:hypothetical protein
MRTRTEQFHSDGARSVEDGDAHPDVTQDEVRRSLMRQLRSFPGVVGIRESWIDEQGRHFMVEAGQCPAG